MNEVVFEIRLSRVDETAIVAVVGEVDMATAPELGEAIEGAKDAPTRVVVDLTEVTFLDSSALNALVRGQRNLAERDIAFRVVSPSDQDVRRVFEITQLTGPLHVVDTLDQALRG